MCDKIKINKCTLTECNNPQPDFCLDYCPLTHDHGGRRALDVYIEHKTGKSITIETQRASIAQPIVAKGDLIQWFSRYCDTCNNRANCGKYDATAQHRTWGSCCLNSQDKFLAICDRFTVELYEQAVKSLQDAF